MVVFVSGEELTRELEIFYVFGAEVGAVAALFVVEFFEVVGPFLTGFFVFFLLVLELLIHKSINIFTF